MDWLFWCNNNIKKSYPWIGRGKDIDIVVLFNSESAGTVIYSNDPNFVVGDYGIIWIMSDFEDFKYRLWLENI